MNTKDRVRKMIVAQAFKMPHVFEGGESDVDVMSEVTLNH